MPTAAEVDVSLGSGSHATDILVLSICSSPDSSALKNHSSLTTESVKICPSTHILFGSKSSWLTQEIFPASTVGVIGMLLPQLNLVFLPVTPSLVYLISNGFAVWPLTMILPENVPYGFPKPSLEQVVASADSISC